jgi:dipeptidyl aminopeptidase/acylaminoacyl peptidase
MDKRSLAPMAAAVTDAGYRAVLLDLRGHGESSGRYLTYGSVEARDVSRVLDTLSAAGVALGSIGVYGFSYGGAVAIDLGASDPRVQSVVAVAPFSSLREVIGDYRQKYLPRPLGFIPDGWFQGAIQSAAWWANFDPDESAPIRAVRRSKAATLLIHGSADTQVPLRHSQALLQAAGGNARLFVLPGAIHDVMSLDPSGAVRREAVAWFDRWMHSAI